MKLRCLLLLCIAAVAVTAPAQAATPSTPAEMLAAINAQRQGAGLSKLTTSPSLHAAAHRVLHFDPCERTNQDGNGVCFAVLRCGATAVTQAALRCRALSALAEFRVAGHVGYSLIPNKTPERVLADLSKLLLQRRVAGVGIAYRPKLGKWKDVWFVLYGITQ